MQPNTNIIKIIIEREGEYPTPAVYPSVVSLDQGQLLDLIQEILTCNRVFLCSYLHRQHVPAYRTTKY